MTVAKTSQVSADFQVGCHRPRRRKAEPKGLHPIMAMTATQKELESPYPLRRCSQLKKDLKILTLSQRCMQHQIHPNVRTLSGCVACVRFRVLSFTGVNLTFGLYQQSPPTSPLAQPPPVYTRGAKRGYAPFTPSGGFCVMGEIPENERSFPHQHYIPHGTIPHLEPMILRHSNHSQRSISLKFRFSKLP